MNSATRDFQLLIFLFVLVGTIFFVVYDTFIRPFDQWAHIYWLLIPISIIAFVLWVITIFKINIFKLIPKTPQQIAAEQAKYEDALKEHNTICKHCLYAYNRRSSDSIKCPRCQSTDIVNAKR